MYFCEKCNFLSQESRCDICKKKNLREVEGDDFCYFVTLDTDRARYFEENLQVENVPVACLGVGIDLRFRTSSRFKMYIPYKHFELATEIYNTLFGTGK